MPLVVEIALELLIPPFHAIGLATLRVLSLGSDPRSPLSVRLNRACTLLGALELAILAGLVGWWLQPKRF